MRWISLWDSDIARRPSPKLIQPRLEPCSLQPGAFPDDDLAGAMMMVVGQHRLDWAAGLWMLRSTCFTPWRWAI